MTRHVPSRPVGSAQFFAVARLALLAVLASVATPLAARAQFGLFGSGFVFDPSNFARNVLHYARRLEQMNLQRQQLGLELAAMRKLPSPSWRQIGSTAGQVDALMAGGQALGYTLRATLNALNRATRDVPTSVAQLDRIKRQLATAQGHEAALELNGTIGMYTAEELTLLRQAVAALTNVQTVYYADQVTARRKKRPRCAPGSPRSPPRGAPIPPTPCM